MPNHDLLNSLKLLKTIANANILQLIIIRKLARKQLKWNKKTHKKTMR